MILILMKGKLNHTDIILPILAGLRKNNFKQKIKLVYPSKGSLEIIKENTSLYKTLKSISQINHFYMTEELQKYYNFEKTNLDNINKSVDDLYYTII